MDEDTHLCLRCQQLVVGLNNYVNHRSRSCLPSAPPVVQSCWSQDDGHPSEPGDTLVSAPDFFSSLELKSAEPKSASASRCGPDQDSDSDQSEDDVKSNKTDQRTLAPPRAHTGGKWKPGEHPEDEFYQQSKTDFPDDDLIVSRSFADPSSTSHEPGDETDAQAQELLEDDLYPPRSHTSGKWKPGTRPELTDEMWLVRSSSPEVETSSYTSMQEQIIEDNITLNEQNSCQDGFIVTKDKSNQKIALKPAPLKQQSCARCDVTFENQTELGIHLFSSLHISRTPNGKTWMKEVLAFQNIFIGLLPYQCAICKFYLLCEEDICSHFANRNHFNKKSPSLLCLNCCQCCSSTEELLDHLASLTHKQAKKRGNHPVVITQLKMRLYCTYCSNKCKLLPRVAYSCYQKPKLLSERCSEPHNENECISKKTQRKSKVSHKLRGPYMTKVHKFANTPKMRFKCDKCNFRTVTRVRLQRHAAVHAADRQRLFECDLCSLSLLDKHSLRRHKERHGVKSYNCSDCLMTFHTSSELAGHASGLHSESRSHLCHICGYASKTQQMLSKHFKRMHSGNKHVCVHPGCSFVTAFGYELSTHMRIHTRTKPYKCPYCKYKTSFQSNLRTHILNTKKHRGKKVYPCRKCNFKTDDWPEFNLHMNQAHTSKDTLNVDETQN